MMFNDLKDKEVKPDDIKKVKNKEEIVEEIYKKLEELYKKDTFPLDITKQQISDIIGDREITDIEVSQVPHTNMLPYQISQEDKKMHVYTDYMRVVFQYNDGNRYTYCQFFGNELTNVHIIERNETTTMVENYFAHPNDKLNAYSFSTLEYSNEYLDKLQSLIDEEKLGEIKSIEPKDLIWSRISNKATDSKTWCLKYEDIIRDMAACSTIGINGLKNYYISKYEVKEENVVGIIDRNINENEIKL